MAKPTFVLVDTDSEYLQTLEVRILEEFGDRIALEVIDDAAYLSEFLNRNPRVDILVITERLYDSRWNQVDMGIVYLLTEENADGRSLENPVKSLYKYANFQKIFGEIEFGARKYVQTAQSQTQKTKIVLVYSASGGAGKTTVALGLCMSLAANHKKVLYVDAENIQDFSYFLNDKSSLPSAGSNLLSGDGDMFNSLRPYIKTERFDYLPPLRMAATAMDVDLSSYGRLISSFQKHVEYDYILVDTDSVFDGNKDSLIQQSDKVVMLMSDTEFSAYKTKLLLNNFASPDFTQMLMICNRRRSSAPLSELGGIKIDACIGEIEQKITLTMLEQNEDIERLSYLL